MLKMRLQRIGRKNQPEYRVIVTDSRNAAKRGMSVDTLGSYQPKLGVFKIDGERAKDWISKGVQVSDTVHNFLVSEKVIEGKKKNVLPKKSPIIDEEKLKAEAEAKAAEEAAAAAAAAPAEEAPAETASEAPTETPAPEASAEAAPAEPAAPAEEKAPEAKAE